MRLSIDPGQHSGIAVWGEDTWKRRCCPRKVFLWHAKGETWQARVAFQVEELVHLTLDGSITHVYCELPAVFDSAKSMGAKGDIIKLAYLVGAYAGVCTSQDIKFITVPVVNWKGQLPKPVVIKRIKKKIGSLDEQGTAFNGDVWDAVGIGLFAKGFF
jgi:hypothetical protein